MIIKSKIAFKSVWCSFKFGRGEESELVVIKLFEGCELLRKPDGKASEGKQHEYSTGIGNSIISVVLGL